MKIRLFNTLKKEKEDFTPLDPNNIKVYVCGPTVYNYPHLGNARSVVVYDLLFRVLRDAFPRVTYVRNITDVDDKINVAAKEKNISIQELTQGFINIFHEDMDRLNVLRPTFEPKATESMKEIIEMIQVLIKNGNAYESQEHVLFDINSYKDYGKLSNRVLEDMIAGSRVEAGDYKKNPLDFVLWKPAATDDDISAIFESPWGKGRPGWHIECSAMSDKFLGHDFDIHGGGADLQFPHHENEIAQSICSNPKSHHAKYWVHNGFLTVNGEKMSKSLDNFVTLRGVLESGTAGIVVRYLVLSTHYRKPLDFSDKSLSDSKKSIDKFYEIIKEFLDNLPQTTAQNNYLLEIKEALADDLNSPIAFSILHKIVKDFKQETDSNKKLQLANNLAQCLNFLGLYDENYINKPEVKSDIDESYILKQIELRRQAKKDKNWAMADKVRDDLLSLNIVLEDKPNDEVEWKFRNQ